ncbi:MAG: phosphatase PAP2 family protein [Armatimonadetes bacterium]|nr:phosphatase PAP2 family protein [Armatimonadota bacterium]
MGLETAAFGFLNSGCANSLYDAVLPVITVDAVNTSLLAAVGIAVLLVGAASRSRAAFGLALRVLVTAVLAVALGELIASHGLKPWVGRLRPPLVLPPDQLRVLVGVGRHASFPSSHAVNTFAVMTALSLGYPRQRVWFLGYAALIAFSRVYVGVHWPTDVLFGMVLGMALAWALWRAGGQLAVRREIERG